MADYGTIPESLQLPHTAPRGVGAYRRRFISPCTNVAEAGPDDIVHIFPDTSTPGAFIDPQSCYLMFDFQLKNTCPFVDYANFYGEGVGGAIIQDLKIFNQGSILEEIAEYGTVASLLSTLESGNQTDFYMYFSNKLVSGYQEEMHRNFIKPPMCDSTGNIMYGGCPQGLGIDLKFQTNAYSNLKTSDTAIMQPTTRNNQSLFQPMFFSGVTTSMPSEAFAGDLPFIHTGRIDSLPSSLPTNSKVIATTPMDWPDLYDPSNSNPMVNYIQQYGSINKSMIMANLTNVKCIPIGVKPKLSAYATPTPIVDTVLPYRSLSNAIYSTGYIAATASGTNSQMFSTSFNDALNTPTAYRITYPLISGIIGRLATKMLATCLMSPQQFYLQLHLATAAVALRVSADPCRRIVGTVRDYIRNTGTANGAKVGQEIFYGSGGTTGPYSFKASTFAPGYGPFHCVPNLIGNTRDSSAINSIFSPASACGKNSVSIASAADDLTITSTPAVSTIATLNASSTVTVVLGGIAGVGPTSALLATGGLIYHPDPTVQLVSSLAAGVYLVITSVSSLTLTCTSSAAASAAVSATNLPAGTKIQSGVDFSQVAVPATPQYALTMDPTLYKGGVSSRNYAGGYPLYYANENQVFYGTYLSASVPQTSRLFNLQWNGLSLGQTGGKGAAYTPYTTGCGIVSYSIKNIALVGDQVCLPDGVASDIINTAADGGYNVHTSSVRTYVLQCAKGPTQSIICPIKVSEARKIFFVFQDTRQRNAGTGFWYDSNCGHNPFSLVEPTNGSTDANIVGFSSATYNAQPSLTTLYGVGWDSPLNIKHTAASFNQGASLSCQLRIGNEFFPQQPLQTMQEIATEFCKTNDRWNTDANQIDLDANIIKIGDNLFFDCTENKKYTTAFTPQEVIDDQTITNNFDMAPLYSWSALMAGGDTTGLAASANTIMSASATKASSYNGYNYLCPRGFCLNKIFEPLSSKFILGFNLSNFKPSDGVTAGTYLGNNTITLIMSGTEGLNASSQNVQNRIVAIVPHRVVMKYAAGGQLIWNY